MANKFDIFARVFPFRVLVNYQGSPTCVFVWHCPNFLPTVLSAAILTSHFLTYNITLFFDSPLQLIPLHEDPIIFVLKVFSKEESHLLVCDKLDQVGLFLLVSSSWRSSRLVTSRLLFSSWPWRHTLCFLPLGLTLVAGSKCLDVVRACVTELVGWDNREMREARGCQD